MGLARFLVREARHAIRSSACALGFRAIVGGGRGPGIRGLITGAPARIRIRVGGTFITFVINPEFPHLNINQHNKSHKTLWPSGLRRWSKVPVRKGVGSNPTGVTFYVGYFFSSEGICPYGRCVTFIPGSAQIPPESLFMLVIFFPASAKPGPPPHPMP